MCETWWSLCPNSGRVLQSLSMIIPCSKSWSATEALLLTSICLYFVSNGPVVRFGKSITLFPLLAFSYACCMVDTTSLGCFPIMTEIGFFLRQQEPNGKLMLYDTSVHQINLSPSLLFLLGTAVSSPTTPQSKTSHCTCTMYFTSPCYMTWNFLLPFRTCCLYCRPGETSQAICSSASQFPFSLQKTFHAFEGCNHVGSWFLFLSLDNYSPFNLPLKFTFPWPWITLFALHQTFSNHSTYFWIQGLKIWFRPPTGFPFCLSVCQINKF